jgi:MFS family permease
MESTFRTFASLTRNRSLTRVVVAYGQFTVSEFMVWIGILVYAYDRGGATTAGLVVVAQLLPAAVVAPLAARLTDRWSPATLLTLGYAVQGLAAAATSVLLLMGAYSYLVYLGAMVMASAISTTRPAQAALLPAVTHEVRELTAAHGLIGWAESVSIMLAGAGVALVLTFGDVGHVCAVASVLMAVATLLVAPLRTRVHGTLTADDASGEARRDAGIWRDPPVRLLLTLLTAEYVVIGALDVLFVVLAINILDAGDAWVGYLNMGYGAGGVILGALAMLLVGRRLGPVIVAVTVLLGAALALSAATTVPSLVLVLLAVVGGCRAVFDVGTRSLLQRAVPAPQVARAFGMAEGLSMVGLAVGATCVPALVSLGDGPLALVGVAALLPGVVVLRLRRLVDLDRHAQVPVVEIALLRSLGLFRSLPAPALEGLARALELVRFEPGDVIFREGDIGDTYVAIAGGDVEVQRSGKAIATLHRGDGLGEIALLRTGHRTATAVALTSVSAFRLDRDAFLTAVTGHTPTLATATDVVQEVQTRDARRVETDSPKGD